MNYTLSSLVNNNDPLILYKEDTTNNLISSISLAVCSILLSITGCLIGLQKSRCKHISLCGGCAKVERTLEV